MKRNKNKKEPKPPAPPTIAAPRASPPLRQSIMPRASTLKRGKGNRGTLAVLPDLQSLLSSGSKGSGGSRGSGGEGSMESKMSAGDIPAVDPNATDSGHHHRPFDGLDIFKRRERSKKRRSFGSDDDRGKVMAPKTLVITMDSKLEEKVEAHGNILRRRLEGSGRDDMAFDIMTQIHDLGELEWMLDDDSKVLLRRHVIYWKCALSMPRRKMQIKDTTIPVPATNYMYTPLTKCQRYNRKMGKFLCTKNKHGMTDDLLRNHSITEFKKKVDDLAASSSIVLNINKDKGQTRRENVFDAQLPAYSAHLANNPMPNTLPKK